MVSNILSYYMPSNQKSPVRKIGLKRTALRVINNFKFLHFLKDSFLIKISEPLTPFI